MAPFSRLFFTSLNGKTGSAALKSGPAVSTISF